MRKILSLLAMMALAGCGGGGGGSSPAPNPNPPAQPTTAPQGNLVTPTFTLNLGTKTGSSAQRNPKYINGTATLSVKITLISNNGTPTTVTNPSVTTDVNGASPTTCNPSCTIPGPPSPPGTDRYSVTTYDATGGGGNVLSTATKDFTIVAGSSNTGLTIVLFGVVNSLTISGVPTNLNAGTTPADTTLTVNALDAASGTITGTYGDNSTGAGYINNLALNGTPVTVTINETNANGATLVAGGGATQNSTTSVTLHGSSDSVKLHYAGLAENVKTITVAATGASNQTAQFQPVLQAITPASGTEIDLYVDSTTGGTGSTGSQTFTEAGFTGTYAQNFSSTFTPTSGYSTPCDQIATISQSPAGVFTATAPAASKPPAAGSCDLVINDNLTQSINGPAHTSTATTVVTYTTSSVSASSKHRHQ